MSRLIAACLIASCIFAVAPDAQANGSGPFAPLPPAGNLLPSKVALGERLFHERRLSSDGKVSCATCHDLKLGGTDGLPHSVGVAGRIGNTNSPTVFNSSMNFRQFWDGRARTLEEQVQGPLLNPMEMDGSWDKILRVLGDDSTYVEAFRATYRSPPTETNVVDALVTFEKSLTTPNARFDRFLLGDASAFSATEKSGFELFQSLGCVACHQGAGVGGNMFQRFGIMGNFFKDRGRDAPSDWGRFNVTRRASDRHTFKVPSLRNVAVTAPYFHDGSAPTLENAVALMGRYQLGTELGPGEIAQLVAFLKTLTGTYRGNSL